MLQQINEIFNFCIALLGLFLAFFLIRNRDFKSNIWLAILNLTLACHFLNLFLTSQINIPHLGLFFGLIYGPLILHFIISHSEKLSAKVSWHFIPTLGLLVWILVVDGKRQGTPKQELEIISAIVFIHLIAYLIQSSRKAKQLRIISKQIRSKTNEDKIQLIRRVIQAISILFLIAILESYFRFSNNNLLYPTLLLIMSASVLIGMFGFIYKGLESPFVFSTITNDEKQLVKENQQQYAGSNLSKAEGLRYLENLEVFMDRDRPYKNYNLSLDELSALTEIPPRYLSQIINEHLNQNFFDFVNSYRIKEAKLQLRDSKKRVSEVMYDIGFSSRSSFNTAFKKYEGQTPSQYRHSL